MGSFRNYRFPFIVGIFLLIALAFFSFRASRGPMTQPAGRWFLEVIGPMQRGVTSLSDWTNSIWRRYFALVQAAEDNERLHKQVARLHQQLVDLEELKQANLRLKELLNFKRTITYPIVAAEVVGNDPTSHFRTVIVDKGASAGVQTLMPVVCAQGVVGRVIWTSPHYAKLLLLIDPNSAVDVLVQRSRARGIVEGQAGGRLNLKYVIHTEEVAVGDRVITSGAAGVFPKGVLVGTVSSVKKEKAGAFQQITVKPAVDFDRVEEVLVILHRRQLD
ncbi:MAG: rod shape-determining protein MreC [Desulfarculus sp.]|nr:MAG: rod shape-determining protein MreC [Desulfarculus sp.]